MLCHAHPFRGTLSSWAAGRGIVLHPGRGARCSDRDFGGESLRVERSYMALGGWLYTVDTVSRSIHHLDPFRILLDSGIYD